MKHIRPFKLNESFQNISQYGRIIVDELDRLGIQWWNLATPKQQENGTLVLAIMPTDGIRLLQESRWLEGVNALTLKRINAAISQTQELAEKADGLCKLLQPESLMTSIVSRTTAFSCFLVFFVYSTYSTNAFSTTPSQHPYGKIKGPIDEQAMEKIGRDFLYFGVRKQLQDEQKSWYWNSDEDILFSIATDPTTNAETLVKLSTHQDQAISRKAKENPNYPEDLEGWAINMDDWT